MLYYHYVVYTPFAGEEADVYIADTDAQYAEWKVYDAARQNGIESLNGKELGDKFDEDEYLVECGFRFMKRITKNEYYEAMRDGEWCV